MGRISDRIQMNNPIKPLDTSVTDDNQESSIGTGRIRQRIQQNSEKIEEPESWGKWAARTALQIPKGIAQAKTWGLDAVNALGYYDSVSDETIDDIRRASERLGKPFDEEAYRQSAQDASSMFPTVSNISRGLENNLGIPLEAKTGVQKFVNFASGASAMAPKDYTFRGMNTSLPKPVLGTGVAATAEAGKSLGIPEPIADIGSFLILKKPGEGAGKIAIGKKTKPSGLVERRFEDIDKTKKVSSGSIERINDKIERDVRKISDEIIEKTPIHETRKALQTDSGFKEKSRDAFKAVENLSYEIPGTMPIEKMQNELAKKVMERESKGYILSDYDKRFLKEINNIIDSTTKDNISAKDLVHQYRRNNKSLGDIYEPGKSFAENKGKRDAILLHNRLIAETIEKKYPNTEFSKLFKETNDKWSKIMDAESIDLFLHELFEGKVNFSKVTDLFEKEGMQKPFIRAMGEEGFGKFRILLEDLMTSEKAYKYIKAASNSGKNELANTMGAYMVSPALGKAKTISKFAKGGYRAIYDFILDKPKIAITWDKAINAAKKGDLRTAEKEFAKVAEAEVQFSQKRQYNEKQIGREGETIEVPKDERVQFRQKTLPNNQLKIENKKEAGIPSKPKEIDRVLEGELEFPRNKEGSITKRKSEDIDVTPKQIPLRQKTLPNYQKRIEQKPSNQIEKGQSRISSQGEKLTPINTTSNIKVEAKKIKSYKEMSKEELISNIEKIRQNEKNIIESVLGKEIYNEYKNIGSEGRFKFWEKHGRKLSDKQIKALESSQYDDLDLLRRLEEMNSIKTSYNIGENSVESVKGVISDIRGALINNNDIGNKVLIKNAIDFLVKKGHSKEEIAKQIYSVMRRDLSKADADFIIKDIFSNKTKKFEVKEIVQNSDKKESIAPTEKKQIEYKPNKAKEDQEFRDRFMAKKDEPLSDRIDGKRKKESPTKLPKNVPAPKKVEPKKILTSGEKIGKLEKLKTQDISSSGLKIQKDFMTRELDKAIEYSSIYNTDGKALILDVPNDGTFNLKYDEKGLRKFRDLVEKIFPEAPVKSEKYKTIPKTRAAKPQSKEYYRAKAEDIYKKEYAPLAVKIQELKRLKKDVKKEESELANILNQISNFKQLMDAAK